MSNELAELIGGPADGMEIRPSLCTFVCIPVNRRDPPDWEYTEEWYLNPKDGSNRYTYLPDGPPMEH